eukprot:3730759-Amphidinium_carterae.2
MCVRSLFCFALRCPLRRRKCDGNHSHRKAREQNHSITAEAEFPFTVTRFWEALKAVWSCGTAEAAFDQGTCCRLPFDSLGPFVLPTKELP